MKYTVRFEQYHTYEVEADSKDEALAKAHDEFLSDMYYPAANTWYDAVDIDCNEDDEED